LTDHKDNLDKRVRDIDFELKILEQQRIGNAKPLRTSNQRKVAKPSPALKKESQEIDELMKAVDKLTSYLVEVVSLLRI
jgi:hypothetical protein